MKYITYLLILLSIFWSSCSTSKKINSNIDFWKKREFTQLFYDGIKQKINNNYEEAESIYNKCLSYNYNKDLIYYELANIKLKQKSYNDAIKYALIAEKLNTNNIWIKLLLANIYEIKKDYKKSAEVMKSIIKINKNPEYYLKLAYLLILNKKYTEVLKVLNEYEKKIRI